MEHTAKSPQKKRTQLKLKPQKEKRWSHQEELNSLVGKRVKIIRHAQTTLFAILLESDQFTLKVKILAGDAITAKQFEKGDVVTLMKHSIDSYTHSPATTE